MSNYQDPEGTNSYGLWAVFNDQGVLTHYRGNTATHFLRLFPINSSNEKAPAFDIKVVPMNAEQRAKAAEYEQNRQQNRPQQGQQRQQAPSQQRQEPPQQQRQNYQPSQPQDQHSDLGVNSGDLDPNNPFG